MVAPCGVLAQLEHLRLIKQHRRITMQKGTKISAHNALKSQILLN